MALIGQDNPRKVVLRERDRPGGANTGLIDTVARYSLDAGYHVVLEGILYADHYTQMLQQLRADCRGRTHCYYLEVDFEETLRRHAIKPQREESPASSWPQSSAMATTSCSCDAPAPTSCPDCGSSHSGGPSRVRTWETAQVAVSES